MGSCDGGSRSISTTSRAPGALPRTVRIRRVRSRSDARDYIGFKHINGAFKWDALAKAKYAAEWFHDGYDIKQISRRLGDRHNTVVRLVNGWSVLRQSLSQGFDLKKTTKRGFAFSHLYTVLARPNVRRFLGLRHDDISAVLDRNPIPQDRLGRLRQLMSWLSSTWLAPQHDNVLPAALLLGALGMAVEPMEGWIRWL